MTKNALLDMAKHASKSQKLIASLIEIYTSEKQVTWDQVASELEISSNQLAKLALCNRPSENQRVQDLKKVADYVGMELNSLGTFITRIENSVTFQSRSQSDFLMAARDRNEDIEDDV